MNVVAVLTEAFRLLTPEQQENLVFHAEKGTKICCGETSFYYVDGLGAG